MDHNRRLSIASLVIGLLCLVLGLRTEFCKRPALEMPPQATNVSLNGISQDEGRGLVVGESYKFPDSDAVYYYGEDKMLHRVANAEAYFRIYNCVGVWFDKCHTVQPMPAYITPKSKILKGAVIEK